MIYLHGALGEALGREHDYKVTSPIAGLRLLAANYPQQFLAELLKHDYEVRVGDLSIPDLDFRCGTRDVHVIPVLAGSGGNSPESKLITGVALVAAVYFTGPAALGASSWWSTGNMVASAISAYGFGLAIQGVSQMLAKQPNAPTDTGSPTSYFFDGATNDYSQGGPVPIVYGLMEVGSTVASFNMTSTPVDFPDPADDPDDTSVFHVVTPKSIQEVYVAEPPYDYSCLITCVGGHLPYTFELTGGTDLFQLSGTGVSVYIESIDPLVRGVYAGAVKATDGRGEVWEKDFEIRVSDAAGGYLKGSGGGASQQVTPQSAPDDLISTDYVTRTDIISEGPIKGFPKPNSIEEDIFIDGTPLVSNGVANFADIKVTFKTGTQNQAAVPNFPSTSTVVAVNLPIVYRLTPLNPAPGPGVVFTVSDATVEELQITFQVQTLAKTGEKGDIQGSSVAHDLYIRDHDNVLQTDGVKVGKDGNPCTDNIVFYGKTTGGYRRTYSYPLSGTGPWTVTVKRQEDDHFDGKIVDEATVLSYNKVWPERLSYPNTAYTIIKLDATSFDSDPTLSYRIQGLEVRVPDNYTPRQYVDGAYTAASYDGEWTGGWKTVWTDNPAWCFLDLLTNERYGVGSYVSLEEVNTSALYLVSKYCDELVEGSPRFTCNLVLNTHEQAYRVLQDFAASFRALIYFAQGGIMVAQDRPSDPVYLFTTANVVDGTFTYSGSSRRSRHNVVQVAWNDPADGYKQKFAYVEDQESLALGQVNQIDILGFGCTSEIQAIHQGKWLLYSEKYEAELCSFKTGYEGIAIRPGDVIRIQDQFRDSIRLSGRVVTATETSLQVDSPVTLETGQTYVLWAVLPSGHPTSVPVTNTLPYYGTTLQVGKFSEIPGYDSEWILTGSNHLGSTYRVTSIVEEESDIYKVEALRHFAGKYGYVESEVELETGLDTVSGKPVTLLPVNTLAAVEHMYVAGTGVRVNITLSWTAPTFAKRFRVDWRVGQGNFQSLPETSSTCVEIENAVPGDYVFRVVAIYSVGSISPAASIGFTCLGKTAPPANVTGFTLVQDPQLTFKWTAVADLDLEGYEIRKGAVDWATSDVVAYTTATTASMDSMPSGDYTFRIKAKDTSGNYSLVEGTVTAQLVDLTGSDCLSIADKRALAIRRQEILANQVEAGTLLTTFDPAGTSAARGQKTLFDAAVTAVFTTFFDAHDTPYAYNTFDGPTDLGVGGAATFNGLMATISKQWDLLVQALAYLKVSDALTGGVSDAILEANFLDPLTGKLPGNTIIKPGSITTPLLAAINIFAKSLIVADFDNLIPNGASDTFPTDAPHTWGVLDIEGRGIYTGTEAYAGGNCREILTAQGLVISQELAAKEGDQHYFRAMCKGTSGGYCRLQIEYKVSTVWTVSAVTPLYTGTTYAEQEVTSPAAPVGTTGVRFSILNPMNSGFAYFDDLYARRLNSGRLIVDGAITAAKLEALMVLASVITSTGYTAGTDTAPPAGFKLSGATFPSTLLGGGTPIDANMEIGSTINVGGRQVATLNDRAFGSYNWLSSSDYDNLVPNGTSDIFPPDAPYLWGSSEIEGRGVYTGAEAFAGGNCRRISALGNYVVSAELCAMQGDQHFFRAMIKGLSSGSGQLKIEYKVSGVWTSAGTSTSYSSSTYAEKSVTSTVAPAGTSGVRFTILNTVNAGVAYFDDLYARRLCGKEVILEGAITAAKLEALLVMTSVLTSTIYTPGNSTTPPVGFKLSGPTFTSTLIGGDTLSANMEIGAGINLGGRQVATLNDRVFGIFNRLQNGVFYGGLSGWNDFYATFKVSNSVGYLPSSPRGYSAVVERLAGGAVPQGVIFQNFNVPLAQGDVTLSYRLGFYSNDASITTTVLVDVWSLDVSGTRSYSHTFSGVTSPASWTSYTQDLTSLFTSSGEYVIRFFVTHSGANLATALYGTYIHSVQLLL